MNWQIFGSTKCFETKKAQRWFQERRIKIHFVDLRQHSLSRGEVRNIRQAVGWKSMVKEGYLQDVPFTAGTSEEEQVDQLLDHQEWLRTPIVRCGRRATVGYCPQIWLQWKEEGERSAGS